MSKKVIKKENGIITSLDLTPELKKAVECGCHLCWKDCSNAYVNKCPKVADIKKKDIGSYDFITDGAQIVEEDGTVDTFIVTGCDLHDVSTKKPLKGAEAKRAKDSLRMAYFETTTVEEAYIIQKELVDRKLLINPKGRVCDDTTIEEVRKREKQKRLGK